MKHETIASLGPAALAIGISMLLASCGGGPGRGDCVTTYTDGDVLRARGFTQEQCLRDCAARTAPGGTGANVILTCLWDGRRETSLPLGVEL